MTDVFIDNKFAGTVKNPEVFVDRLISERRMGKVSSSMNVRYSKSHDIVFVETARGRTVRPLVVVREGKSLLTKKHLDQLEKNEISWSDLLKQGIIEYLDSSEEENALVGFEEKDLTPDHTHLEVSSIDIVGIATGLVPFGNFNQGARLSQGSKNQKQGIGFYAANYLLRMDMDTNLLHYPQVPIVSTLIYDLSKFDKHPSGQNVTLAIMSYEGYNIEDALIVNKGSIERGLARSTHFRPVLSEELRYSGGLVDEIGIPDKECHGYRTEKEYRFLEDDGIVFSEANVKEGNVVIGKTSPPRFLNAMDEYNLATSSRRESSMSLGHGEKGVVDFVMLSENEDGNRIVQVRLRDQRIPEVGDKFTSRHAQKGVISIVVPEKDMPFTSSGIRPDFLFTPYSIPSRMTVGHLLDLLGGKVGALSGRYIDGTIFESENEKDLRNELKNLGFREDGAETMYSGTTGEKLDVKIFTGNIYYLKLRHQVANKIQSRARGPVQLLTRQPTEGRAKEGGLRLGEMEKDTLVAHGASLLLKERFDSDSTIIPICDDTGYMATYDVRKKKYFCPVEGDVSDVSNIEVSYAFKLMLDEFRALGLNPLMWLGLKY